jgi:DNA-binding transcriptional ArsR family regulator
MIMPRKQKLDKIVQEFMVVEDPAAIKLLFTPKYTNILKLIQNEELSLSDIARALDINPGSAHYHLKELEKHGLVKQVREEIKGGVVKKFYRKAARNMTIDVSRPGNEAVASETGFGEDYKEKMLNGLGYFVYRLSPGKIEEAKAMLTKCDMRSKAILKEVQQVGLEKVESNRQLVADTYQFALLVRLVEDKDFNSCMKELIELFEKKGEKNTAKPKAVRRTER